MPEATWVLAPEAWKPLKYLRVTFRWHYWSCPYPKLTSIDRGS